MQRAVQIPAAIVMAIQGLVVLFVVGSDLLIRRPDLLRRRSAQAPAEASAGIAPGSNKGVNG
jgi:simple sugar transport system permease protein